MLEITLLGFGNMGRMIGQLAESNGCRVVSVIDPVQPDCLREIRAEQLGEVCIDFSLPNAALDNIRQVAELGRNLVVGTTGWHKNLPEVEELVARQGIGLLYGANFSIGMNVFQRVVKYAAALCAKFPAYDVCGWEIHHNRKADSPSGTAIQLSDAILASGGTKDTAVYDKLDRRIEPRELHFASVRGGSVPGTHSLLFDSETDSLELTHRVRSRACFAVGALQAAKWIADRKGLFTFNQMLEDLLC